MGYQHQHQFLQVAIKPNYTYDDIKAKLVPQLDWRP